MSQPTDLGVHVSESVHEAHERRASEWWELRPSRARICPRVAAGKRCLYDHDDACVCYKHNHVLDHARIWLDRDGRHIVTAEPYGADGNEIAALISDMADLGLEVRLSGHSPWNPGQTLLIRIEPTS